MDFVGLARTVLIIVIVWQLGKLFFRFVMPWLLTLFVRKVVQKSAENFQRQSEEFQRRTNQSQAQSKQAKQPKFTEKRPSDDKGEYIDYEEVE